MVKSIGLIRRNPAFTQEQFIDYWKTVHVPLVKKALPGLRSYVGLFPVKAKAATGIKDSEYDAIIELGFDSVEALEAAMSNPAFMSQERQISSTKFMDMSRSESMMVEEVVIAV
jgi:uncharacterized protein (TIGR02118 family)